MHRLSAFVLLMLLFLEAGLRTSAAAAPTVGATTAFPMSVVVRTPTVVTATVVIPDPVLPGGVNLVRQGAGGKTTILGVMHDDGLGGDAVAGDHVYTLQVTLNESAPGTVSFVATAAFKGQLKRVQSAPFMVTVNAASAPPQIKDFSPKSAAVGQAVTVTGSGFTDAAGDSPHVLLAGASGGGTVEAGVGSASATSLTFTVPVGASSGPITVKEGPQSVSSSATLTITSATPPVLSPSAAGITVLQGQSSGYTVSFGPDPGFTQLATLSVSGLPSGMTGTFSPPSITSGEFSLLTVTATANQTPGDYPLTITASVTVNGVPKSQSLSVPLHVLLVTTSFIGRTVVDDALETPLAGVTVKFLGRDDKGNPTGANASTVSDASGNFTFTNLPASYVGKQLVSYDGLTATSPAGKYAGVNLTYTLIANQVTTSPVLIHLPRIDNAETVMVQQNAAADQTFTFKSIPKLAVTVYAHTTFTLADGSQPNPFPLIAVQVPVDRLPDTMPQMQGGVMPFIVAFQPANTTSSQPVAVTFPNTLMTPPNTDVELSTLDPTKGYMVQYGTGMVTANGIQIVPDPDPAHPGHRYGLVHFDWHGPATPPNPNNPSMAPNAPKTGCPVDLASGIETESMTDAAFSGARGGVSLTRNYRTFTNNIGPFGLGGSHNYNYQLNTNNLQGSAVINLIMPDGSQVPLSQQANGTLTNTTDPMMLGAVLTPTANNEADLRWKGGTVFHFVPAINPNYRGALLTSITDRNGNVTTITRAPNNLLNITKITDPVGRSLTFSYGGSFDGDSGVIAQYPNLITSVTDPLGRTTHYSYKSTQLLFGELVNSSVVLSSVTDPAGGVTQYDYTTLPNGTGSVALVKITDPRGTVVVQDTYDANGRVIQQKHADGGVTNIAYTLLNPLVPTSPVQQTVLTDPLGRQTTYRFSPQGFPLGVTDPSGQTTTYALDPGTSEILSVSHSGTGTTPGDFAATYDANGNVLTATDALGNTTTLTYEPTFNQVTSITDALGHTSTLSYDGHGNLLTATDPNGKTTHLTYNGTGQVLTATDSLGKVTQFTYGPTGDLAAVMDPLGHIARLAYDAVSRPVRVSDPLGRVSSVQYDSLDRVLSTTDPLGHVVSLSYDPNGNLLTLTDALGHTNTFTYDALNRPLTRKTPLGRMDTRQYDLNGNLTQFTDRRGQVSQFGYDVRDELTGEMYQDGSKVARTYDAYGRLLNVADTAGGTFTYAYDLDSRLIGQASPTGAIQYAYDAASELTARQVAGQPAATYAYDPAGRLLSAVLAGTGLQFTYDDRNEVTGITRANGVDSQFAYDAAGRLTNLTHAKGTSTLYAQSYNYDAASQRTASALSAAQTLITQPVVNTYDAENHLLTNGATTDAYDADGNLTSETGPGGTTAYAWDTRGRLVTLTRPNSSTLHFTYDPDGLMIGQTDSATGQTRSYLLDALTNVVAYNDGVSGQTAVLTGLGIDSHFAVINSSGASEYGLTDALNSTTTVADGNGAVQAHFAYEPYGQTTATGTAANYPFQYTGRIPVSNNLYYNRLRFYNAGGGRFISEDPLGVLDAENPYSYASDNPASYIDSTGEFPLFVILPAIGGLINGSIKAYLEYERCGHFTASVGKRFIAGVVGGVVGTSFTLLGEPLGPVAAGGVGGGAGEIAEEWTNEILDGKPLKLDPNEIEFAAISGEASGGVTSAIPSLRLVGGAKPKLTLNRTFSNLGRNSQRLIGQEGAGDTQNGIYGTAHTLLKNEDCGCD